MNAFHIQWGECDSCTGGASMEAGSKACTSCGTTFEKLCLACAKKRCPKCKGKMAPKHDVFPHSLFRTISVGNSEHFTQLLRDNIQNLDEIVNSHGDTLLHQASRAKGSGVAAAMCQALLDAGMSPRVTTSHGRTALTEMVRTRVFAKDASLLLAATVNQKDDAGCTALMFASQGAGLFGSRKGNITIARTLLSMGADPLTCDNQNRTALGHAFNSNDTDNNEEMIEFLKDVILSATARRQFDFDYSLEFDDRGNLRIAKR